MPLQLDAYYVDRLTFEVVDDWDDDEPESSWDIEVDPTHLRNEEDPFEQQVALSVRFGPAEGSSAPYRGEIAGRAFFRVTDEDDLDKAAKSRRLQRRLDPLRPAPWPGCAGHRLRAVVHLPDAAGQPRGSLREGVRARRRAGRAEAAREARRSRRSRRHGRRRRSPRPES